MNYCYIVHKLCYEVYSIFRVRLLLALGKKLNKKQNILAQADILTVLSDTVGIQYYPHTAQP